MATVKGVFSKDVVVLIEFSLTELEKIKAAMDFCQLTYFGTDQYRMDAQEHFKKSFYSFVAEVIKDIKGEEATRDEQPR